MNLPMGNRGITSMVMQSMSALSLLTTGSIAGLASGHRNTYIPEHYIVKFLVDMI